MGDTPEAFLNDLEKWKGLRAAAAAICWSLIGSAIFASMKTSTRFIRSYDIGAHLKILNNQGSNPHFVCTDSFFKLLKLVWATQ